MHPDRIVRIISSRFLCRFVQNRGGEVTLGEDTILRNVEIGRARQKWHDYFLLDIALVSDDEIVMVDVHLVKCAFSWPHLIANWPTSTIDRIEYLGKRFGKLLICAVWFGTKTGG